MCKIFQVSRQGYYQYLKRRKSNRTIENDVLLDKIKQVYYDNKGLYGSPRIAITLNDNGIFVSKNIVARHMRKINLQARAHKRKRNSYRKVEANLISDNLVK